MDAPGDGVIRQGEIIFGRYIVEACLGSGATGSVYLVRHINLQVQRALKCIPKSGNTDICVREADILKDLRHPAIPIIYDIEENDECVCIIEEFVEGLSLKSQLLQHKFSVKEAVAIAISLCDIVNYLHNNGVFHHDIKPDNIIYHNGTIKLLDYGNSIQSQEGRSTGMGTKWYAAPEVYECLADAGSDIYAIGVLMLTLVTGGRDTDRLDRMHPQAFGKVVRKCILHNERERYKTVTALSSALAKIFKNKSIPENINRKIAFVGAGAHCGTTHAALMAAYYLNRNHRTLFVEHNMSGHFMKIITAGKRISFKDGIFTVDGLDMIPNYDGCINRNIYPDSDIIISDCGVYDAHRVMEIMNSDIICVVGDVSPQHIGMFDMALSAFEAAGHKVYALCNMADPRRVGNAFLQRNIVKSIRVPYMPDFTQCRRRSRLIF